MVLHPKGLGLGVWDWQTIEDEIRELQSAWRVLSNENAERLRQYESIDTPPALDTLWLFVWFMRKCGFTWQDLYSAQFRYTTCIQSNRESMMYEFFAWTGITPEQLRELWEIEGRQDTW